jgi:hypothetical protein
MNGRHRERIPPDLGETTELLRRHRPEAGPLELDRIKLRATASRRRPDLRFGKDGFMRSKLIGLMLVIGLLGGGTGALAAVGTGPFEILSGKEHSSNSQYCPPTSHQPGKPKKPGPARCGRDDGDDNGSDDGHGHGNAYGHGNGNGNGDAYGHGNAQGNGNAYGRANGAGKGSGKKK